VRADFPESDMKTQLLEEFPEEIWVMRWANNHSITAKFLQEHLPFFHHAFKLTTCSQICSKNVLACLLLRHIFNVFLRQETTTPNSFQDLVISASREHYIFYHHGMCSEEQ
jgi:hypothetical protein